MKLYKLTDENAQTYGGCQWGEDIEHNAPGKGPLCADGWLHAYTDSLLAVLLNPIHANFMRARLWEAEGDVGETDHGLKVGCTRLKTIREIPLPEITEEQRIRFAIACARRVFSHPDWDAWADAWLSGTNRTADAARAARAAAKAAEAAKAAKAARAAAWAAEAAKAAAWAAEAAKAARAARATAKAAEAAKAAAWAAAWAAEADDEFDLAAIAQEAIR